MSFTKITEGDLANKGVTGLPDTPNLSTTEMQQKFDELAKDVIVPKFNELSAELDEKNLDKATVSEDITNFQLDADGRLQVSTNGGETYGYAGSTGHAIMDGSGTVYPARARLQFSQNVGITDDEVNNKTFLSVQGQKGDQGDAATIRVGTVGSGLTPSVTNVGSSQDAIFDFVFPKGDSGDAATIQVGTVQSGNNPSVTNRGTSSSAIFDFVLPKGEKGDPGTGLTLLDTYPTLAALQAAHPTGQRGDAYLVGDASDSTVYLWSTVNNQWSDVGSLKGAKGDTGDSATVSVGTVTEGNTVAVENVGTSENAIFNFTLKKGDKGDKGNSGTISVGSVQGGEIASVTNVGTSTDAIFNFVIPKGDKGDKGDPTSINGKSGLSVTLYGTDIDVDDSVGAKKVSQALSDIQDEIDNMNTGGSIIRVTCDEDFAGNTLTMEVNGTLIQTLEVPSVAPYVVEFSTIELGTATITNTDTSDTFDVELTTYSLYTATFTTFGYQGWLDSAGITTQFASLAEVLADQPTVRLLMIKHASVDYLVEWLNADTDTQATFLASEYALKWIGLKDYAYDTITSSVDGFLASWLDGEYWEYALKDKVPIMTSNNAPYGVASASDGSSNAYLCFDGKSESCYNYPSPTAYIQYEFTNPIDIRKIRLNMHSVSPSSTTYKFNVELSNDGFITKEIIDTNITVTEGIYEHKYPKSGYYKAIRIQLTGNDSYVIGVYELQVYGRQLSVSVPKMTSNSTPYGVVSASHTESTTYDAYKAFDGDNSTLWSYGNVSLGSEEWISYEFVNPICPKRAFVNFQFIERMTDIKIEGYNGTDWDLLGNVTTNNDYTIFDNNEKYYKKLRLSGKHNSTGDRTPNLYTLQFYGLDYSEHEERHWIYDHGVEVEEVSATNTSGGTITKTDDEIKINRTNGNVILLTDNAIDLTDYTYFGARFKTNTNYSAIGTSTSRSTTTSGIDIYTQVPTTGEYEYRLNITNANENRYVGAFINNTGYLDVNELWLE